MLDQLSSFLEAPVLNILGSVNQDQTSDQSPNNGICWILWTPAPREPLTRTLLEADSNLATIGITVFESL
ncbi:hypothetical protein GJ744_006608 [Endocarpon pusillum]|uniref:Uncharacterized protein n=1 Tax=Endocarpon pusillum TaxID=364733 RepID=A0A8H7AUX4_9EURO|nr:hypothetical protein GJ744_006608 [Endocarpon pusillum]